MTSKLRVRLDRFDELTSDCRTDIERARLVGVHFTALSNLRRGRYGPGVAFIDGCMRAFGPDTYFDLFYRDGE